jgi:phospholipid transport system substrate-binding protein
MPAKSRLRSVLAATALFVLPAVLLSAPQDAQAAPAASEENSAMATFKARHAKVIRLVKKKASTDTLQTEVDRLLDYRWLAHKSLGGEDKYAENCGSQCDKFDALLTRLIRENYLRLVRKAKGHEVEYLGQVKGKKGDAYLVKTKLTLTKEGRDQVVSVNYVMRKMNGRWVVNDIITDDVSLAKTYRYEFNKIMKSEGMDGIIRKLEDKLDDLDVPA